MSDDTVNDETHTPVRLPIALILAAWWPTIAVVVHVALVGVGLPHVQIGWSLLAVLWLVATVPLLLLLAGFHASLRAGLRVGHDEELAQALSAIARAEAVVAATDAAVARLEREGGLGPATGRARPPTWTGTLLFALGLLAVVSLAGVVLLPDGTSDKIHEHATFAVFIEGERVPFSDAAFDLSATGYLRGHLHAPDQDLVHIEGKPGLTLGLFFEHGLGAQLTDRSLGLLDVPHDNRTVTTNETHTLRLYVAADGGDTWERVWHIAAYEPRDRDRMLLTYGPGDALPRAEADQVSRTFVQ